MKVYTALSLVLILIFLSLAPFAVSKIVDSSNSNYFPKNNNNNIKPLEQNYIAYFNKSFGISPSWEWQNVSAIVFIQTDNQIVINDTQNNYQFNSGEVLQSIVDDLDLNYTSTNTSRHVLAELFTTYWGSYDPGAVGAMDRFARNTSYYPSNMSLIEWHPNSGGFADQYGVPDSDARINWYFSGHIHGYPKSIFDGIIYEIGGNTSGNSTAVDAKYKPHLDNRSKIISPLNITTHGYKDSNSGWINASVELVGITNLSNLKVHFVIVEDVYPDMKGTAYYRYTARDVLPEEDFMPPNEVPTINTTNDPNATEDQEYAVDYDADDPDNDTVTWSLNTNATWLIINPITGLLNGTPTNDDVGSYWVNVSVWDGKGGFNSTNFTLNVTNVNDPPVITTSNTIVAIEDISYSVDYDAVDIDPTNDILTWSLDSNATWLSIDSNTGVLSGTPTNDDVGPYFVNVSVSDGNGGENWTEFILWVGNINDPPIITTSDIITATEDILYSVDYDALDVDPTNDVLTWTVISNASWLSITYYTGILNGTPTNADVGWFDVNVIVGDGNSKYDSHEFILTVTNVAPAIITSDLVTVDEDSYYYNDYDSDDDGQGSITWSLSTNAEWLTLDEGTGVLTGTPGNDEVGVYWVNIEVEDGNGGIGTTNFNLEVINTNDPPVIDGTDILTINEDEYYEASYSAADIDVVDILTWTYGSNASWLNWGEDNHTLYGTPDNDDVGSYGVRINLSDENGGYDEHYFSLNVININDPPSIIGAPTVFEVYAYENETVDFADYVIDVDNDISELSLSVESEYADLQDLLVTFNYPNSVSLEKVKITVSDGIDTSDPHFIQFTIDPVDIDRPTITDKTPISTNIAIDTDITVTFSESMAESITETAFVISPEVSGAFSWADTIMTFDPDSNLRYNTIYILTIKTTATDLTGNSLEKPYTWNFTTIKLDTDGDGIPDDEDNDDDNDGFLDDWEEFLGTDAQASNDTPLDTDGDGSPDGDEANAHPWMDADDDGDGVSDSDEHGIGTDPLLKDTDGDGYSDDLDEFPLDDKRWEKAKSTQDSDEDDSWIGILISIMVIIIVVILLFIFIIKPRLGAKMEMEDSAQESMETQQSQIPHQPAQTMPKVEPQMPNIRIHQQPLVQPPSLIQPKLKS